jgi:hypothetical protein
VPDGCKPPSDLGKPAKAGCEEAIMGTIECRQLLLDLLNRAAISQIALQSLRHKNAH